MSVIMTENQVDLGAYGSLIARVNESQYTSRTMSLGGSEIEFKHSGIIPNSQAAGDYTIIDEAVVLDCLGLSRYPSGREHNESIKSYNIFSFGSGRLKIGFITYSITDKIISQSEGNNYFHMWNKDSKLRSDNANFLVSSYPVSSSSVYEISFIPPTKVGWFPTSSDDPSSFSGYADSTEGIFTISSNFVPIEDSGRNRWKVSLDYVGLVYKYE